MCRRHSGIVGSLLLVLLTIPVLAQQANRREGNLKVGDTAPDFAVQDADGNKAVKLSELKGKPVVLIFGSCT